MKGGRIVSVPSNKSESALSMYFASMAVLSVAEVRLSNGNMHIPSRYVAERELNWDASFTSDIDMFAEQYKSAGAEGYFVIEYVGGFSILPIYSNRVRVVHLKDDCKPTADQFYAAAAARMHEKLSDKQSPIPIDNGSDPRQPPKSPPPTTPGSAPK